MKYTYNIYCNTCKEFDAGFILASEARNYLMASDSEHDLTVYELSTNSYFDDVVKS